MKHTTSTLAVVGVIQAVDEALITYAVIWSRCVTTEAIGCITHIRCGLEAFINIWKV